MNSPFLIILLVFLLLIVLQLTLKLKINYNLLTNKGKIQLRFVGIRVFDKDISIYKNYIKLSSPKKKNIYLPIELSKESIQSYADFQGVLFQKIYAKELTFYLNFGLKDNPMSSCLTCGHVDVFTKIFFCILNNKKRGLVYRSKIYPCFSKSVIKFQIKAKISVSLFDLLWSYFEAVITGKLKYLKEDVE